MYDFAITDFPSFMITLPKYQRIYNKGSSFTNLGEGVKFIITEQTLPGSASVFEYVSDRNYVTFIVDSSRMYLKIMHVGETVIDSPYSDFSEVKTDILKYT